MCAARQSGRWELDVVCRARAVRASIAASGAEWIELWRRVIWRGLSVAGGAPPGAPEAHDLQAVGADSELAGVGLFRENLGRSSAPREAHQ